MEALGKAVKDVVTSECCQSCSLAVVPDDSPSYALFHEQDAERAFNKGGKGETLVGSLYIGFGSAFATDAVNRSVGRVIVEGLTRAGFHVQWDGSDRTRIKVVGVTDTRTFA